VENSDIYIVELTQGTRPMASCSGFRGSQLAFFYRRASSMHRNAEAALHSIGCSYLSLSSYLVVDKLLLGLLL
jgi:hypothetical protein